MKAKNLVASLLETDIDDPESIFRSQPSFRFVFSAFEGFQVWAPEEHDKTLGGRRGKRSNEWPQNIGNVVQGPENRWYVIHARGLRNDDYGWGVTGNQSYDTKEQAALAIWTRQHERVGHLPDRKYKRYR